MSKNLEKIRFLFPNTKFIINLKNKELWELSEMNEKIFNWAERVIDWRSFERIVRPDHADGEILILKFLPDNIDASLAFRNPALKDSPYILTNFVIKNR